jgi:hypothetical protein
VTPEGLIAREWTQMLEAAPFVSGSGSSPLIPTRASHTSGRRWASPGVGSSRSTPHESRASPSRWSFETSIFCTPSWRSATKRSRCRSCERALGSSPRNLMPGPRMRAAARCVIRGW